MLIFQFPVLLFAVCSGGSLEGDQSLGVIPSVPKIVAHSAFLLGKLPSGQVSAVELRHLSKALKWQGKLTGAAFALETLKENHPADFTIEDHLLWIKLLRGARHLDRALLETNASLSKLNPRDWYSHFTTGMIFLDVERFDEAERSFRLVRRLGTIDGNPSGLHVATLLRQGRVREAAAEYQMALGGHAMVSRARFWPEAGVLRWQGEYGDGFGSDLPSWTIDYSDDTDARAVGARELAESLRNLQFPRRCSGRRYLVYSLGSEKNGVGLGSTIHSLAVGLSYALREGLTMVLPGVDEWWYSPPLCPRGLRRGWECFFESFSSCSHLDTTMKNAKLYDDILAGLTPTEFLDVRDWIPQKYARFGALWYRSQLVHFLWRLRPWVQTHIEKYKLNLKWSEPIIALHIRRGDWKAGRALVPTEDYIAATVEMAKKHRISNAYLATDDVNVVQEVLEWSESKEGRDSEIRYLTDQTTHTNPIENSGLLTIISDFNRTSFALDAIATVELLSIAQVLVCTFGAHFGRLAHELRFARDTPGFWNPTVTLDTLWFLHP